MKKIISLMIFLGLVSAISGGVLAFVNDMTAPIIKDLAIATEKVNLELIFPNTTYEAIEVEDETGLVTGGYIATGEGYIFKGEVRGYSSSPIVFMVGISNDGEIVDFKVLSHTETSGIGSRIETDEYLNLLTGKKPGDAIDTLSGATVSSKAVQGGIYAIFDAYAKAAGLGAIEKPVETEKPVVAITLNDDYSSNEATIESDENGVYVVSAKGYEGRNQFEITVDGGYITSVKVTKMLDTEYIGDKILESSFLDQFIGLTVADTAAEVDVATGATFSSKSAFAAIQAVMLANDNAVIKKVDGDLVTYVISSPGYYYEENQSNPNVFVITLNSADNTVVSVECKTFSDTKGLGDKAITAEHLAKFEGKTLDTLGEVDAASGATVTSTSVKNAVKAAFEDMKGAE